MKKFIITVIAVVFVALYSFGQGASPTAQLRIANATTAFGINIPKGYTIYDVNADKYYVCKAATSSSSTLTTASANFTQVNGGSMVYPSGSGIPIVVSGTSWGSTITDNSSNWNTAYGWGNHALAGYYVNSLSGSLLFKKATGLDSLTFGMSGRIGWINAGYLYQSTAKIATSQGFQVGGDFFSVASYNYLRATGTSGVADSILMRDKSTCQLSMQRLAIDAVTNYSAAADSLTTCHIALSGAPVSGSITVTMNGMPLNITDQYTIQTSPNRLRITVPVYTYDRIQVKYTY